GGALRPPRNDTDPTVLSFAIQTAGSMEDILKFLDQFYRSDQLHKITKLTLTPTKGRDEVTASIDVEALAVQGTKRKTGLAQGISERLAQPSAKEYIERITSRNLFAEYKPPRPERPPVAQTKPRERPVPPKFDD